MFHQAQHVHGMRLPQILFNKGAGEWEEFQDSKERIDDKHGCLKNKIESNIWTQGWGSRFEDKINSSAPKFFQIQGILGAESLWWFCISWSTTAWHSTSSCVRKTRSSMLNLKEKGWICGSLSSLETLGCWCHVSHPSTFQHESISPKHRTSISIYHRRGDASWTKKTPEFQWPLDPQNQGH